MEDTRVIRSDRVRYGGGEREHTERNQHKDILSSSLSDKFFIVD